MNLPKGFKKRQKGQALLLVVLSLAVVLTVILSLVARSISNIQISVIQDDSQRALIAAEAGIEKALLDKYSVSQTLTSSGGDLKYDVEYLQALAVDGAFVYPEKLHSGESASFWFVSHDIDGSLVSCASGDCFAGSNLEFCWGDSNLATDPGVEISFFYDDDPVTANWQNAIYSNVKVARYVYDPAPANSDFNTAAPCNSDPSGFAYGASFSDADLTAVFGCSIASDPGCLLMAKVKFYKSGTDSHPLMVKVSGDKFPSQGERVISTGVSNISSRKLDVFLSHPSPPFIFDTVLNSEGGLVK